MLVAATISPAPAAFSTLANVRALFAALRREVMSYFSILRGYVDGREAADGDSSCRCNNQPPRR